tara:strand:+ start:13206 stop:14501 length:1296 start_codon:yes stop_codon:yes gene_type:complete
MALPTLTPASTSNKSILPITGTTSNVNSTTNPLPVGIYMSLAGNTSFISGASDQVGYVYKKLGGDVLDIEITEYNVYAAYEEACLEYSYIVNVHQAKNSLGDLLGNTTASFDQDGQITSGHALSGSDVSLRFPRYTFQYAQRAASGIATQADLNGDLNVYSASFSTTASIQDYDLQSIVSQSVASGELVDGLTGSGDVVGNNKITIREVFYRTPRSMWRFFAYYGGLNVIGNMSTYGQYSDDSQFEVIPTWQNKLQAIMYEDSIRTRVSNYSYEIHNNKLRLFPEPIQSSPEKFWFTFTVQKDSWEEYSDKREGAEGINNMNTLPFANIPFANINSIGKQWIRRYALALSKEMLGQIRGKLGNTIPLPGGNVNLNAADLLSQAKAEQSALRDELIKILDELTYAKLAERDAKLNKDVAETLKQVPVPVFVG